MVTIQQYRKFLSKGNKYGAVKTVYGGVTYDSKSEATRAQELDIWLASGEITDLERQTKFPIIINGVKVFTYIADFTYYFKGLQIVEDVKGMRTAMFNLKKKCVEAQYGIIITIV